MAKRSEARNYRPDRWVLLRAQITEDIDAEIEQRPSSEEVWLNVVGMRLESGEQSRHPSVEAAQQHAIEVTGVRQIVWRKR